MVPNHLRSQLSQRDQHGLHNMKQVLPHEFVLVLLENEVNDVANLCLLEYLIIALDKHVQNVEAQLGVEVELQLNLEGLGDQSRLVIEIVKIDTAVENAS